MMGLFRTVYDGTHYRVSMGDIEDLENSIVKKGNKLDSLKNSLSELEKYESNGKLKIHSYNQPKYSTEKFSIYFDKSELK